MAASVATRGAFGAGGMVLVDYGRPSVRERTVWGGTLIPLLTLGIAGGLTDSILLGALFGKLMEDQYQFTGAVTVALAAAPSLGAVNVPLLRLYALGLGLAAFAAAGVGGYWAGQRGLAVPTLPWLPLHGASAMSPTATAAAPPVRSASASAAMKSGGIKAPESSLIRSIIFRFTCIMNRYRYFSHCVSFSMRAMRSR